MKTVTVIIVTYRSAPVLKGCLQTIAQGMKGVDSYDVIVVDNASGDGWRQVVEDVCPEANVIELDRNRGYAAGINAGLRASKATDAVLVLNPDVRLHPGAVMSLLAGLDVPGTGVAVPRMLDADGRLQHSLRRRPTALRALGEAVLGGERASRYPALGEVVSDAGSYDRVTVADWATGAALLISAACLDEVGTWDESFFLYSEETEFQLRAQDHGYAVRFVPDAVVVHLGGESNVSPELWALLTTNRVRLHRLRHGPLAALAFWAAATLNEAARAGRGSRTHKAALAALVRPWHRPHRQTSSNGHTQEPGVVCFSAQDWWYHNRAHSDFQLMREVAKTRRVLLINSIGLRMPRRGRSTQVLRRLCRKLGSVARFVRRPDPQLPNFWVMTPVFLPFYRSARLRAINGRLVRAQVTCVARLLMQPSPICVVTIPTAWEVVRHMKRRVLVLNRSDLHSAFGEADRESIEFLERELLVNADRVLYVSHALMDSDAELTADKAVFLDHGVDLEHFRWRSPDEEPAALVEVPHPRMGFFGALDDYTVDFDLLERVARAVPEANLVLIGDSSHPMTGLLSLPNVWWLGFQPYDTIPAFGSGFDVALMPWQQNEWIQYCNPIKLKEYLALGLPVVTTDFPEAHYYRQWIRIGADADGFVAHVRDTLVNGDGLSPGERRTAVAEATWSSRAQRLLDSCESPHPGRALNSRWPARALHVLQRRVE